MMPYNYKILMIHLRTHSMKMDHPKPERPVYERPKNKKKVFKICREKFLPIRQIVIDFVYERPRNKKKVFKICREKFLPIRQIVIDFPTKVSTFCSVSFLLRSGIALWSYKNLNKSISRFFTEFLCKLYILGACSLPELLQSGKKYRDLNVHSQTNYLEDHLNTAHWQISEQISKLPYHKFHWQ